MIYAADTTVPADRSRAEIELMLKKFGAEEFAYRTSAKLDEIAFKIKGRFYRRTLPRPSKDDPQIKLTAANRLRNPSDQVRALEQAIRSSWRALALHIKARIVAVQAGITTLEREFLPDLLLPNSQTTHEWLLPQIAETYQGRKMPRSLIEGPKQPRLASNVIDQEPNT